MGLIYLYIYTDWMSNVFCIFSKHGLVASGKNTLYLAGGEFPDGSASRSMWRYDPVLDVWQEMAPMLVPRSELGKHVACTARSCFVTLKQSV